MPTGPRPDLARLRAELSSLLDAVETATTLDAEDDALEQLGAWAHDRLGPGWEPLYAGVRLVGVAGEWRGRPIELRRS
jgi:hypothetical protein